MRVLAVALAGLCGCTCPGQDPRPGPPPLVITASVQSVTRPAPSADAAAPPTGTELAPGLTVERVPASVGAPVDAGDATITLVRIDPARFELRLLIAARDGTARRASEWARDFKMTGVINASMYQPDGRSTGLMIDGDFVGNANDDDGYGAIAALGSAGTPRTPGEGLSIAGRDCQGTDLDVLRKDRRTVWTNYRLLDCDGKPVDWKDEKIYSAAAIAVDKSGRAVFVHARTPYRMRDFAKMLAAPELALTAAMYVEGGPEASLYVETARGRIAEMGSWETGFTEHDNVRAFWPIPNVLAFAPRR